MKLNLLSKLGVGVAMFGMAATASAFEVDGYTYKVVSSADHTVSLMAGAAAYPDTVVIPEYVEYANQRYTVTEIGANAFDLTTNLKSITFPASLKVIQTAAFFKPTSLRQIIALGKTPADISSSPFATTILTNATLMVPDGCWYAYQTQWTRFYNVNESGYFNATVGDMNFTIMSPTDKYARTKSIAAKYKGDVTVPATIEVNGTTYKVVEIGAYTFDGCAELTSVTMPEGLLAVGAYAMRKANALTSVKFPSTVTFYNTGTFNACTGLKSVDMGTAATRVENVTFQNCTALESVILPPNCVYVGPSCFSGCKLLQTVSNTENLTTIMSGCFQDTPLLKMTLPSKLVMLENTAFKNSGITFEQYPATLDYLEANVFYNCPNIEKVVITTNLTKLGASALAYCKNLKSVTFPDSVGGTPGISVLSNCPKLTDVRLPKNLTFMPAQTFLRDSALVAVDIPETVVAFHNDVFNGCVNLKNFDLPTETLSLAKGVFQGCISLTEMSFPESVSIIGAQMFANCTNLKKVKLSNKIELLNSFTFQNCVNLTEVECIDSITTLANSAFAGCTALTEFTVPKKTKAIWNTAFKGCTALKSITLNENLDSIAKVAFQNCTALTEIRIPASVRYIKDQVFNGCTELKTIYSSSLTPPELVVNAFDSVTYAAANLYVKPEARDAYAAAEGWKNFIHQQSGIETADADNDVEVYGKEGAIVAPEDARIYTITGVRTGRENLASGIYIVACGRKTYKVVVR